MALGMSKLFGMDLLRNFNYPYFSRDIAEFYAAGIYPCLLGFDYLYIPLGGSKGSKMKQVRNVFIIFVVSGFGMVLIGLIWLGIYQCLVFLPLLFNKKTNI
jgi:D-alanyl-lipoteichoic acid acyltransferase DltB (MBOAT superfamily)